MQELSGDHGLKWREREKKRKRKKRATHERGCREEAEF